MAHNTTKFYHGTSYENGMSIILSKHFGSESRDTVWKCSEHNDTYVVRNDCDNAFKFATEAGQIAAAHFDSQSKSVIVFEFEVPTNESDDYFSPDVSCENMNDCYCIENKYLNKYVENGEIKIKAYELSDAYRPYLRLFYMPRDNSYYKSDDDEINKLLKIMNENDMCHFDSLIIDDYIGYYKNKTEINVDIRNWNI